MIRIAITGPDGSGKTSVCQSLEKMIEKSKVVYAGKYKNHLLKSTTIGLYIWKKAQSISSFLGMPSRYFIFYPLEYLENYKRFTLSENKDISVYIYDRHPIDRTVMYLEYKMKVNRSLKLYIEIFLLSIISWFYKTFFPKIDYIFILYPKPELCYRRASGGEYKNLEDARKKVAAFYNARISYNIPHNSLIEVDEKTSIEDIRDTILNQLHIK